MKTMAMVRCGTCLNVFELSAYVRDAAEDRQWQADAAGLLIECPTCFKKRLINAAVFGEWPELIGSEEEIAKAENIRSAMIKRLQSENENYDGYFEHRIARFLAYHLSAMWWISHRDDYAAVKEAFLKQNEVAFAKADLVVPITNNLKAMRESAGLTQQQLADLAGISKVTIEKYENGTRRLAGASLDTALKISKALNVPVEKLT